MPAFISYHSGKSPFARIVFVAYVLLSEIWVVLISYGPVHNLGPSYAGFHKLSFREISVRADSFRGLRVIIGNLGRIDKLWTCS